MTQPASTPAAICAREREIIGWDHGQIGAFYLGRHNLADEIVAAVQYHDAPETAPRHQLFAAAIQVADYAVRNATIANGFEQVDPIENEAWTNVAGWRILFGSGETEAMLARASISRSLQRLPTLVAGLL
jgi:hypothetical protein